MLSTFPEASSGNVGDRLITHAAIRMLKQEKGETDFKLFFREDDLGEHLDLINRSRAVIMPGFAVRRGMYRRLYRLVDDLAAITVPLIPMGAGWNSFPGDAEDVDTYRYDGDTLAFLEHIAGQVNTFACRDYHTVRVLKNHGIAHARMVGDCGWYDPKHFGSEGRRPEQVRKLIFTTPHKPACRKQAIEVIGVLADLFPKAERHCALHSVATESDNEMVDYAERRGFQRDDLSHEVDNLSLYDDCDLHVGYRCHGHITSLSKRVPSVLINEDARSIGFSYTFDVGGFNSFTRTPSGIAPLIATIGRRLLAAKRNQVTIDPSTPDRVRHFLEEETESRFRRYLGVYRFIDETYDQAMRPFLQSIP